MGNYNIQIGKVIEVSNAAITLKIDDCHNYPYAIINAEPTRIGGVGSFLKVGTDIYEVINEKESIENSNSETYKSVNTSRILIAAIVGFFEDSTYFQGSSGNTPNIFENVFTVTDIELNAIYASANPNKAIHVGKYLFEQSLPFFIDVNKYFASHSLIVGNTGSGKSNTLNTIYTELFSSRDTKKSYFLVVDTNGEYSKAFTDKKTIRYLNTHTPTKNDICIPISKLEATDWKLLLEATEKTQYPIVKKVWSFAEKEIFAKNTITAINEAMIKHIKDTIICIVNSNTNASTKLGAIWGIKDELSYMSGNLYESICTMIDDTFLNVSVNNNRLVYSASPFNDISITLITEIRDYDISYTKKKFDIYDFGVLLNDEHLIRVYKYNSNEQNTSPLISRFISSKRDFSYIFTPFIPENSYDLIGDLFGNNNVLVCDVTKAKKDIRRVMVTFICSKLYNYFVSKKRNKSSLHLIVDEAHNYLSDQKIDKEDAIAKTCIETFESIIKEGRKFGVFLTISTQRPGDITGTLLSQAHNYVIHKLVNPRDIEIIKNTVPFIDATSMKMLSILASGQAIFTGTAFNRPNIVQVKFEDNKTIVESETIGLDTIWTKI